MQSPPPPKPKQNLSNLEHPPTQTTTTPPPTIDHIAPAFKQIRRTLTAIHTATTPQPQPTYPTQPTNPHTTNNETLER